MENWSNDSCLGYTIKAMEELDFSEQEIQEVVNRMKYLFDMRTLEFAKMNYITSKY